MVVGSVSLEETLATNVSFKRVRLILFGDSQCGHLQLELLSLLNLRSVDPGNPFARQRLSSLSLSLTLPLSRFLSLTLAFSHSPSLSHSASLSLALWLCLLRCGAGVVAEVQFQLVFLHAFDSFPSVPVHEVIVSLATSCGWQHCLKAQIYQCMQGFGNPMR